MWLDQTSVLCPGIKWGFHILFLLVSHRVQIDPLKSMHFRLGNHQPLGTWFYKNSLATKDCFLKLIFMYLHLEFASFFILSPFCQRLQCAKKISSLSLCCVQCSQSLDSNLLTIGKRQGSRIPLTCLSFAAFPDQDVPLSFINSKNATFAPVVIIYLDAFTTKQRFF